MGNNPLIEKYGNPKADNPLIAKYGSVSAKENPQAYSGDYGSLAAVPLKLLSLLGSKQYLKKAGVPEGSTSKTLPNYDASQQAIGSLFGGETPQQLPGKISALDIGSTALDFAAPAILGKLGKFIGKEKMFASPFRKQDLALIAEGKQPISKILWNRGKTPLTPGQYENGLQDIAGTVTNERSAIDAPIKASSETGSMKDAVSRMQNKVSELSRSGSPYDRQLSDKLQKEIDAHLAITENPTYNQLMDVKRGAWESIPRDKTTTESKVYNALGGGAAEESYNVANRVSPGSGPLIKEKNSELSSVLASMPEAQRIALREAAKSPVTQVDIMAALTDPSLYVGKNIVRHGLMPLSTAGGRATYGLGMGLEKAAPINPWLQMYNDRTQGQ